MHIPPYKNKNIPIIDTNNSRVPFVYFNNINLTKNKIFISDVIGYETCFVPVTGTFSVNVGNLSVKKIGKREKNVWDNDPEGIYIPLDEVAEIKCLTEKGEGFIAGAKYSQKLKPFMVGFIFFFFLSPVLYAYVSLSNDNKRTDYPGKEIAIKTQYVWDQQFNSKINVVYGNEWNAGNLSYHLKSRPVWEGFVEREKLDQLKDYMCIDNVCVGSK